MLSTEQINDLHRLYWSEHWPIRKIERHLRMGWHTILDELIAKLLQLSSRNPLFFTALLGRGRRGCDSGGKFQSSGYE